MSTFAFNAGRVAIEHLDGEFSLVGFADSDRDPETYLTLQRALEFDEQNSSLGMDTYHVEWCDQGSSGYGGISRAVLTPTAVELAFDAEGSAFLGGLQALRISFQLRPGQLPELRRALERIFEGSGCLVIAYD